MTTTLPKRVVVDAPTLVAPVGSQPTHESETPYKAKDGSASVTTKGPFLDLTWKAKPETPLAGFVADISDTLIANEKRERQRNLRAQAAWDGALEALLCALARDALLSDTTTTTTTSPLVLPLANNSRYSVCGPHSARTLQAILKALAANGFVTFKPGRKHPDKRFRHGTTVRTEKGLRSEVEARGISLRDFSRRLDGRETIVLTTKTKETQVKNGLSIAPPTKCLTRIEYEDTRATRSYRAELHALNAFLDAAVISFVDDGMGAVDIGQRLLSRYFVQPSNNKRTGTASGLRFNLGGRLFGAFWSNLERSRRRASLRIDGAPIAEVDMHAAFPRLAYARQGLQFDSDAARHTSASCASNPHDPYDLPGISRGAVKKALNAMLFAPDLKRWPNDIAVDMPEGVTVRTLREAILEKLPGLVRYLGGGMLSGSVDPCVENVGLSLMFDESKILLATLKELMALGVVALPLHDAVLVRADCAELAKRELEAAALRIYGVVIPAHVKKGAA